MEHGFVGRARRRDGVPGGIVDVTAALPLMADIRCERFALDPRLRGQ
ncbi:hypothetical protein [Rubrivivax gelatinosus]|nr:hypothetical protein [Rubrivivax gelatinosus]